MDKSMDAPGVVWNNSYVSCIKINGKSILPPLMTPKRREEMGHYKEQAKAVEARLQRWKRASLDSGVCSERTSIEQDISGTTEGSIQFDNPDVSRGSSRRSKNSVEYIQNNVVQDEAVKTVNVADSEYPVKTALENNHIECFNTQMGKAEQNSGLNSAAAVLSSDITAFQPWDKIHTGKDSKEDTTTNKACQPETGKKRGTWKLPHQAALTRELQGSLQQRWVKNKDNSSMLGRRFTVTGMDYNDKKISGEKEEEFVSYAGSRKVRSNSIEISRLQSVPFSSFASESLAVQRPEPEYSGRQIRSWESSLDNVCKPVKICEGVTDFSKSLCTDIYGKSMEQNAWESMKIIPTKQGASTFSSPESCGFATADVSSSTLQVLMHGSVDGSVSSIAVTSSTDLNHYLNTTGSSASSPGQDVSTLHSECWPALELPERSATLTSVIQISPSGKDLHLESLSDSNLISKCDPISTQIETHYLQNSNESNSPFLNAHENNSNFQEDLVSTEITNDNSSEPKRGNLSTSATKTNSHSASICKDENIPQSSKSDKDTLHATKDLAQCDRYINKSSGIVCVIEGNEQKSTSNRKRCISESETISNVGNDDSVVKKGELKCLTVPSLKLQHNKSYSREASNIPVYKCPDSLSNSRELLDSPPRLVRQNSYTLDSPSPALVAHIETQKDKLVVHDMTEISLKVSNKTLHSPQSKTKNDKSFTPTRGKVKHGKELSQLNKSEGPLRLSRHMSKSDKQLEKPHSCNKDENSLHSPQTRNKFESDVKISSNPQTPRRIVSRKSGICLASPYRRSSKSKVRDRQNTSLPASHAGSPVKVQSPFVSLDSLPSAVSKEPTESTGQVTSTPTKHREALKGTVSSFIAKNASLKGNSPSKNETKTSSTVDLSTKQESPSKNEISQRPVSANISQQDLQNLVMRLQSEHSQQMAELLSKQKKEQEELQKAFLRQQSLIIMEINSISPAVFATSESQHLLNVQGMSTWSDSSKTLTLSSTSGSVTSTISSRNESSDFEKKGASSDVYLRLNSDKEQHICQSAPESTNRLKKTNKNDQLTKNALESTNGLKKTNKNDQPTKNLSETPDSYMSQEISKNITNTEITNSYANTDVTDTDLVPQVSKNASVTMSPVQNSEDLPNPFPSYTPMNVHIPTQEMTPPAREGSSAIPYGVATEQKRSPPSSCSRQLFPATTQKMHRVELEKVAAIKITAAVKGYLTRRLFRTARVQDLIQTIRDVLLCAFQIHQDCLSNVTPEDVELHRRLINQVTAACYNFHDVFFSLSTAEQMAIIAADRERIRNPTIRPLAPRPLSAATRRALERKMLLRDDTGPMRRPLSAESRPCSVRSGNYEMGQNCISRRQHQNRRSFNLSGEKKPWR